mmetsp:Transcript_2455/g.8824  ORF Transcript_2455/g.8824 Transcript_2455/m.8824 type:complete len:229 (-) Transcript_2455:850-1536(-)
MILISSFRARRSLAEEARLQRLLVHALQLRGGRRIDEALRVHRPLVGDVGRGAAVVVPQAELPALRAAEGAALRARAAARQQRVQQPQLPRLLLQRHPAPGEVVLLLLQALQRRGVELPVQLRRRVQRLAERGVVVVQRLLLRAVLDASAVPALVQVGGVGEREAEQVLVAPPQLLPQQHQRRLPLLQDHDHVEEPQVVGEPQKGVQLRLRAHAELLRERVGVARMAD